MKVICIDNSPGPFNCAHRLIKEGEIYTAYQCNVWPDYYRLVEVPIDPKDGRKIAFRKTRFVPCSDIDERDMIAKRHDDQMVRMDRIGDKIVKKLDAETF